MINFYAEIVLLSMCNCLFVSSNLFVPMIVVILSSANMSCSFNVIGGKLILDGKNWMVSAILSFFVWGM